MIYSMNLDIRTLPLLPEYKALTARGHALKETEEKKVV